MSEVAGLSQNHFQLFDFPESFDIDLAALTERYRRLQRAVHPDRFANASDQERRIAMQRTAQLNEAFQVLKNPLQRARYLLQLQGVDFNDDRDTQQDPVFLMEQMELRESLQEIKFTDDPVGSLMQTMQSIDGKESQLLEQMRSLLESQSEEARLSAKSLVHKLQFMQKLRQEAEAIEESLLDS